MKPAARKKARQLALQGVYSWQISQNSITDVELHLASENDMQKVDMAYFSKLLKGVAREVNELDSQILPHLSEGRQIADLDPVELATLRLSVFELVHCIDVPYKVVINEGIELAKSYGAADSHKFVNGVLDKAVKIIRANERK